MSWLRNELDVCKKNSLKAIVCGHIPIHAKACEQMCLAWNAKEVLELLWQFEHTVIAYFAGHDHAGGYFRDKHNIHHITFAAIIETPPNSNAYATVKVYNNKVSVEGIGRIMNYEIYF
jgi:manganese-dependent ADP-ribose/CDP-alcohol diphosphatase